MAAEGHRVQVGYHKWMLQDEARTEALKAMIADLVRPGDVVADLGTGTGVLAALARKAGAARVYAIDASPIVHWAGRMAQDNGLDQMVFIQADVAKVELPEQVDVVFSECLGNFGLTDAMFDAVGAFARRWLKPGGRRGPTRVQLFLQPIDSRPFWDPRRFWSEPWEGLDLSVFVPANYHQMLVMDAHEALLKSKVAQVADFDPFERPRQMTLEASWRFEDDTMVSGLAGWFDVDWAPNVTMSTGPSAPSTHWRQSFFPVVPRQAAAGERLNVTMEVAFDEREVPTFSWRGVWFGPDGAEVDRFDMDEYTLLRS